MNFLFPSLEDFFSFQKLKNRKWTAKFRELPKVSICYTVYISAGICSDFFIKTDPIAHGRLTKAEFEEQFRYFEKFSTLPGKITRVKFIDCFINLSGTDDAVAFARLA